MPFQWQIFFTTPKIQSSGKKYASSRVIIKPKLIVYSRYHSSFLIRFKNIAILAHHFPARSKLTLQK